MIRVLQNNTYTTYFFVNFTLFFQKPISHIKIIQSLRHNKQNVMIYYYNEAYNNIVVGHSSPRKKIYNRFDTLYNCAGLI